MSTQPPSLPFSLESQRAWYIRLQSSANKNRSRPKASKLQAIREILVGVSSLEGEDARRLRHEVKVKYELVEGVLKVKRKNGISKKMVTDLEVFDLVVKIHIGLGHAGSRKTFAELDRDFYGISRQEVEWILNHCSTCAVKKSQTKTAPLKPIVSSRLFERVQVDLIDMSSRPDGGFKWICHIKDHFSKYSQAYPILSKHSENVCDAFLSWISHLGPPKILQCDNGTEFKGAMLLLVKEYGIRIINGRARHPQSQGLIEQANGVLKEKLSCWMRDHQSIQWRKAIPEVILAMNSQQHSSTQKPPYEIVFGQRNWGERILFTERANSTVLDEDIEGESLSTVTGQGSASFADAIIDPQLVNANTVSSDVAISRSHMDEQVKEANDRARQAMVLRDTRDHKPPVFRINDMVTLKIPRQDRLSSGVKRLICRILAVSGSTESSYTLMSEHGIISRPCAPREMELIPNTIQFKPEKGSGTRFITIRRATKETENRRLDSTNSHPYCTCTGGCKAQRCPCFRAKRLCGLDCHKTNQANMDKCDNLDTELISFSDSSGDSERSDSSENIESDVESASIRTNCRIPSVPITELSQERSGKQVVADTSTLDTIHVQQPLFKNPGTSRQMLKRSAKDEAENRLRKRRNSRGN